MRKFLSLFSLAAMCCLLLPACSDDAPISETISMISEATMSLDADEPKAFCEVDTILPLEGDSVVMRKKIVHTRAIESGSSIYEELQQLDQIPIYLQIKGNTSSRQFLSASGEGKELTFEVFKENDLTQQFYIRILPASTGIPYMIYSKKTNTPISLGAYSNNPDVKVVYAKPATNTSTFGTSWDIRRGEYYPAESFIIENQDYPRQGSSGLWYDIYYSVITANGSKVSLDKYTKVPNQEFSIVPVEDFRIESVTFDTNVATLSNAPYVVFSDKFTNSGPIDQNHTFSISESYRESSSFNRRTSYNVNITTKVKVKVPFIANGEISTSVSEGQDFTYGESEEVTHNITRTYPISVPANYTAQMTLTLSKYSMDVEYCAVCVGKTSGRRINIRGTWKGVDVQESDAFLKLTPINGARSAGRTIKITDDMISSFDGFIKVE